MATWLTTRTLLPGSMPHLINSSNGLPASANSGEPSPDQALRRFIGLDRAGLGALLALVARPSIEELEIVHEGIRLLLRRGSWGGFSTPLLSSQNEVTGTRSTAAIPSPGVGRFSPRVVAGERVVSGQTLGDLETLGVVTLVGAPCAGVVDAAPVDGEVEFGQTLMVLAVDAEENQPCSARS